MRYYMGRSSIKINGRQVKQTSSDKNTLPARGAFFIEYRSGSKVQSRTFTWMKIVKIEIGSDPTFREIEPARESDP